MCVRDESATPGETDEFQFELPEGASDLSISITSLTGVIAFRIKQGAAPDLSDAYHYIDFAPLQISDVEGGPGVYYIRVDSFGEGVYSFDVSYVVNGFDSGGFITPLNYLLSSRNPDGGWGVSAGGESDLFITARVLATIRGYAAYFDLAQAAAGGAAWLKGMQNPDHGFGEDGGSVYETAMASIAIREGFPPAEALETLNWLLARQETDGSWNNKAFDTAMALWAHQELLAVLDPDGDEALGDADNCPDHANPGQGDGDGDGLGDACDEDDDDDGLPDVFEEEMSHTNPLSADTDGDGIPDGREDPDFDSVDNAGERLGETHPRQADIQLYSDMNLMAYPAEPPAGYTSFDLLADLGTEEEVDSLERYNTASGAYETAMYKNGEIVGDRFPITPGVGLFVYMKKNMKVSFGGRVVSPVTPLAPGLNIAAVPCPTSGYTSYDLLADLGSPEVVAGIQRFNGMTGAFETTGYRGSSPSGARFKIVNGEGYVINMKTAGAVPAPVQATLLAITTPVDGETTTAS
ncbi:MAG: hypothetical protein GY859_13030, partial [Desulfobacterales bacterium]|nr:hypothetical protein [Desulfobacterales bacterium]